MQSTIFFITDKQIPSHTFFYIFVFQKSEEKYFIIIHLYKILCNQFLFILWRIFSLKFCILENKPFFCILEKGFF